MSSPDAEDIGRNCDIEKQLPQKFSLPFTIIYYVSKHPASPIAYQKLIQSCKYFFAKNPIIVTDEIKFGHCYLTRYGTKTEKVSINIGEMRCKFWVLEGAIFYELTDDAIEFLRDNVFQIDTIYFESGLNFDTPIDQILRPEIAALIKAVHFEYTFPEQADGTPMTIEKLFEFFPNVTTFVLQGPPEDSFTNETAKKIISCPAFKNLERFELHVNSERFDFQAFAEAMKMQPKTDFLLDFEFEFGISTEYQKQLQNVSNEIVESYSGDYLPPDLSFEGGDIRLNNLRINYKKLNKLYPFSFSYL